MSDRFELKAILSANAESMIGALKSVEAPAKAARKYLTDIGKSAAGLAGKAADSALAAVGATSPAGTTSTIKRK